ncbi:hypothetical protein ACFL2V_09685 [Pseudomonadota bacterium]
MTILRTGLSLLGIGMTTLLAAMLASGSVMADVFLYHAPGSYDSDSDRKQSSSSGIYMDGDSVELGVEKTVVEYNSSLILEQTDITAVWKLKAGYMHSLRLGVHYASSDEVESRGKSTIIAETLYYPKDVYGAALYYTKYDNDEVEVWQFSPRFGRYVWPSLLAGTFYLQAQVNAIAVSTQDDSQNYTSVDLKSHWAIEPWGIELGAWFGKQRSAVTDGGFTVYNLNDRYTGGLRLSTSVNLSEQTRLKLGSQVSRRQIGEDEPAHLVTTWIMGFSHEF